VNNKKKVTIQFETWNKTYTGDNQKTILEHGEDAGLIIPASCRAGMCGSCRAKLISGEVTQLADDGLTIEEKNQGYILCCSSIAQSDVVIKHR
jgi:ferredoxin